MTFKVLLLTLLVGLFFIIGMLIPKFFHNKHKLLTFTTSLSFIIILFLIIGDLIPEVIEIIESLKQEDNWNCIESFIHPNRNCTIKNIRFICSRTSSCAS